MSRSTGKLYVHGGLWNAETDEPITAGDRVILTGCFPTGCFASAIVTAVKEMTAKVEKERGEV